VLFEVVRGDYRTPAPVAVLVAWRTCLITWVSVVLGLRQIPLEVGNAY
jgi:hypothetical protein